MALNIDYIIGGYIGGVTYISNKQVKSACSGTVGVTFMVLNRDYIIVGGYNGDITYISNDQVRSACSGTGGVTSMALNRDYLIVGGSDGGVKLWSLGRTTVKLLTSVR